MSLTAVTGSTGTTGGIFSARTTRSWLLGVGPASDTIARSTPHMESSAALCLLFRQTAEIQLLENNMPWKPKKKTMTRSFNPEQNE